MNVPQTKSLSTPQDDATRKAQDDAEFDSEENEHTVAPRRKSHEIISNILLNKAEVEELRAEDSETIEEPNRFDGRATDLT